MEAVQTQDQGCFCELVALDILIPVVNVWLNA